MIAHTELGHLMLFAFGIVDLILAGALVPLRGRDTVSFATASVLGVSVAGLGVAFLLLAAAPGWPFPQLA